MDVNLNMISIYRGAVKLSFENDDEEGIVKKNKLASIHDVLTEDKRLSKQPAVILDEVKAIPQIREEQPCIVDEHRLSEQFDQDMRQQIQKLKAEKAYKPITVAGKGDKVPMDHTNIESDAIKRVAKKESSKQPTDHVMLQQRQALKPPKKDTKREVEVSYPCHS